MSAGRGIRLRKGLLPLTATVLGLASTGLAPAPASAVPGPLSTAVYHYLGARKGDVTVAVYDNVTGRSWWWHVDVRGYTASIVKADILATLLRRTGGLSRAQGRLATRMIEVSDNNAATALYAQVGRAPGLAAFNRSAGMTMTTPRAAWGLTTTSSRDQVTLMRRIAFPNRLLTNRERAYELSLMRHLTPSQRWGVTGGVPRGVSVALKNGWLPLRASQGGGWQVNSIGYVNGKGRDYVIAVLTHSPSFAYGITTIRGISSLVYAYLAPARRSGS